MKKNLIWGVATIAALAFTSCSKSDISESLEKGTKLHFRLSTGKTTKAVTEIEDDAPMRTPGLSLYSFDTSGVALSFPGYAANKVSLTYGTEWAPGQDVYLPSDINLYPISLYSTFPDQANVQTTKAFSYTISYNAGASNDDVDLLVANASIESSAATTVDIEYAHALAQVIVTVRYANQIANTSAKVENCTVSALYGTGTYDFTTDSWAPPTSEIGVEYDNTVADSDPAQPTTLNKFVYFPQEITSVKFDWEIYNNGTATFVKGGTDHTFNPNLTLLPGFRYYLDIIIDGTMTAFKFNVSVKRWEDDDPRTDIPVK